MSKTIRVVIPHAIERDHLFDELLEFTAEHLGEAQKMSVRYMSPLGKSVLSMVIELTYEDGADRLAVLISLAFDDVSVELKD